MRLKLAMTSKVEGPVVFLAGWAGGGGLVKASYLESVLKGFGVFTL